MNRQKFFLAISMLARIASGIVSLFLLARGLGPTDYGFIATVFAYASIAALLTDFGFSLQALRDIGAQPERAGEIMAACVRVKNVLVLLVSVVALVLLLIQQPPTSVLISSILLYASIITLSYGDLALVAFRGIGRYDVETYVVVAATVAFVAIVGAVALLSPDLLSISIALLLARVCHTALSFFTVSRYVKLGNCLWGPLGEILRFARQSTSLAIDSILTTLSTQIDVIFISSMLGLHSTGIYQVASRVANYVYMPSGVLAGVYTPTLASHHHRKDDGRRHLERRMRFEFAGIGLVLGGLLVAILPFAAPIVFGHEYIVPFEIWVAFGALIFIRFAAAAFGVALVARRGVIFRLIGQGVGVSVIVIGLLVFLPIYGLVAAPWVMVVATVTTMVIYAAALKWLERDPIPAD